MKLLLQTIFILTFGFTASCSSSDDTGKSGDSDSVPGDSESDSGMTVKDTSSASKTDSDSDSSQIRDSDSLSDTDTDTGTDTYTGTGTDTDTGTDTKKTGDVKSSCSNGKDPYVPFGSHKTRYSKGAVFPDIPQKKMDSDVKKYYDTWKKHYLQKACGAYRIYCPGAPHYSVSEGHGYGMLIIAYMAGYDKKSKEYFDGLFNYFKDHSSGNDGDLMAWAQDKNCHNIDGDDSASDGDLDIAYSLLLAHHQWGSLGKINYLQEAIRLIDSIMYSEVNETNEWVLAGDWASSTDLYNNTSRTSDFMPGHFTAFEILRGTGEWGSVKKNMYSLFDKIQKSAAPKTGLIPDFIRDPGGKPHPAQPKLLEGPHDGDYDYNACRDPWRITMDYLINDNKNAAAIVSKINSWINTKTAGVPAKIKDGYKLDGTVTGKWDSPAFTAPLGVAALVKGTPSKWSTLLYNHIVKSSTNEYFEDTVKMLSLIAISGNWWAPQQIKCN